MAIEVTGLFADVLEVAPKSAETIATNIHGNSWTKSGADQAWARMRSDLETSEPKSGIGPVRPAGFSRARRSMEMRHSLAAIVRELGASDREVADVLNDKSASMAKVYADEADAHADGNRLRKAALEQLTAAGMEIGMENAPISSLEEARRKKQNRA